MTHKHNIHRMNYSIIQGVVMQFDLLMKNNVALNNTGIQKYLLLFGTNNGLLTQKFYFILRTRSKLPIF